MEYTYFFIYFFLILKINVEALNIIKNAETLWQNFVEIPVVKF